VCSELSVTNTTPLSGSLLVAGAILLQSPQIKSFAEDMDALKRRRTTGGKLEAAMIRKSSKPRLTLFMEFEVFVNHDTSYSYRERPDDNAICRIMQGISRFGKANGGCVTCQATTP
jgi:hypothetical protein